MVVKMSNLCFLDSKISTTNWQKESLIKYGEKRCSPGAKIAKGQNSQKGHTGEITCQAVYSGKYSLVYNDGALTFYV